MNNIVTYQKIRITPSKGEIAITYEVPTGNEEAEKVDIITHKSQQEPSLDFHQALQAIATLAHANYGISGTLTAGYLQKIAIKDTEEGIDAAFTFKVEGDDWKMTSKIIHKNIGGDMTRKLGAFLEKVGEYANLNQPV